MAEATANPSLGGYDEEFVSAVEEDFLCPICQLPLKEAVQTSVCGHRFCRQCLDGHFMRLERGGNPLSCPVDRNNLIQDKDHLACCPLLVVSCTNKNCHVTLVRKNLELHVTTTCQWRLLCCNHCSLLHPACRTEAHQDECRRFPLNCPRGCGTVIAREEIAAHIEKDCVLTIISCPYVQMGCTEKIKRGDVESHLQTEMKLHLDLTCVKLTETGDQLHHTQVELYDTKETTRKLEEKFEEITRKLEKKFEETTRELEEKVVTLENRLVQYSDEHMWKISGFSEIWRQAKRGQKTRIESDPFYTGKYGYKFKIQLNPDGSSKGKTTHLSVYFVMLKGEYDAILPWPFLKKVTFVLIDQQEDPNDGENIVMSLTPDPKEWNMRPITSENTSGGFAKFVSHNKLNERRFIVNDTIFIKIKIEPPQWV